MISPERFILTQTSAVVATTVATVAVTANSTIHTKGSWTSLIAVTSFDAFMCVVFMNGAGLSNTDTSQLVDIGYDPAGGTTYTVEIPNILGGGTPATTFVPGRAYCFPVSIPKGSQVAARNQALITSDVQNVGIRLIGGKNRSNPFPHRGAIQDYGTNLATSNGTQMANAAANTKGAWTQLGADTTRRHSGLVLATAPFGTSTTAARLLVDIGIDPAGGSSYTVVVPDVYVFHGSTEEADAIEPFSALLSVDIPAGSAIAARASTSGTNLQAQLAVAAYAF